MKIALVQQNIIWGDPSSNREHLDSLLDTAAGADLVLLPEMFSTGFVSSNPELAESQCPPLECRTLECQTLEWMKSKASRLDCAIAGSVAVVARDGSPRNRFYFVEPGGKVTRYDKKHLFTYGGEDRTFSAGGERVIVEWHGFRMLLAVCYDLRFPVWLRNRGDYDGMLIVASWPETRRYAWDTLLRARAIENQCFVAAVNRVGTDPSCRYDGGTVLLNPYGELSAGVPDGSEGIAFGEFDLEMLNDYRRKFPVMQDADDFILR